MPAGRALSPAVESRKAPSRLAVSARIKSFLKIVSATGSLLRINSSVTTRIDTILRGESVTGEPNDMRLSGLGFPSSTHVADEPDVTGETFVFIGTRRKSGIRPRTD